MQWFNNLMIGVKLVVSFIIVAMIAAIVGIIGIVNINSLEKSDKQMYENITTPIVQMSEISSSFQRVRVNLRDSIIAEKTEDIEANIQKIADRRSEISILAEEFSKTILSERMTNAFGSFTACRDEYAQQLNKFYELVRANKDSEAIDLIAETGAFGIVSRAEQDAIELIIQLKEEDATNKSMDNDALAKSAFSMMIIVILIAVIIAVVLGLFLSRIISTPIKLLADAADKLAIGNVNVDIRSTSKDEIGKLMDSFGKMVENIKEQAATAEKLANGDFTVNVVKKSDQDILSISMKTMEDSLKHLLADANMLSKAAEEGQLSTRADASKHKGDYAKIIEGVNMTLAFVVEPIQEASEVLQEMEEGNLQRRVIGNYKGDHADIKNALNDTLDALFSYVNEISSVLGEMANSNMTVGITNEFKGEFVHIKDAINLISNSMNSVLGEVESAAEQVATGSRQVSDSSMSLSQGATEQASSIEELTASIEVIANQTKKNAENANEAKTIAEDTKVNATQGNEQMQHMLQAMDEINASSNNISKIIKVIDEIAFQTNILALNAAVEAARAGQHGKGFAVVAEEVRNLAARSANAAKETTAMIEGSIVKVEGGTKIANVTAEALNKIVEGIGKAANLVSDIAIASNEQAISVEQINQGISQIADVVQTTSATSEETAAASEELSSQAELLRSQIGKFKLKKINQTSNYNEFTEINPEVLRMLETMSANGKNVKSGKSVSRNINLSDTEFGKY